MLVAIICCDTYNFPFRSHCAAIRKEFTMFGQ